MTENKRWRIIDKEFISYTGGYAYMISNEDCGFYVWEEKEDVQKVCNKLNESVEENQLLRKIIIDLQNMIQFDVDNGIETYPKTLSEYLANALKVIMNDRER